MNTVDTQHDDFDSDGNHDSQNHSTGLLVFLILLPLIAIGFQLAIDLKSMLGIVGYQFYKLTFLIPPLIYCRVKGILVFRDIFKLRNWREQLPIAIGLGLLAVAIFWGIYFSLGDILLDKEDIVKKIEAKFSVSAATVLIIAPITIFFNSLLEEFFYRGFSFGLLVKENRWLGYLLPATVFTIQHVLFIYDWASLVPFLIGLIALFTFAIVLQWMYEKADSIFAPWLIHMFGDLAMMVIAVILLWGAFAN